MKILAIDGGGIRGLVPALLLSHIEEKSGKKIAEMFDIIAGTSTGGILVLGLNVPDERKKSLYSSREIADIYIKDGNKIFKKSPSNFLKSISTLGSIKYNSNDLKKVLKNYFGDHNLKDTVSNVLVSTYDVKNRKTIFYKTTKANKEERHNKKLLDIAMSTSAAPTYFRPHKSNNTLLIDAGIFVNNIAMCAVAEVNDLCKSPEENLVVSLGTGTYLPKYDANDIKSWGIISWASHLIKIRC